MGTRLKANEKISYVENSQFVLDRKYCELKLIGKGSYGVVCKAKDTAKNMPVAIKKITPMAKTVVDAKHVLREVRIMRHMGKHENIITIEDIFVREANDELYIIMELFDSDLHQVIQSSQVLTEPHHRHFMHQLLCGVKYLHDNHIIHRDLKPGNLLVSRNCALRITDFGLARERPHGRVIGDDPSESIDEPMTEHVITRWYRPPELMLCPDGMYTYAVDIWSCGCIFGELVKRKALFPGKNFIDQLSRIFDVIGSPNALEVSHIENQEALKFLESQKAKQKVSFHKMFPGVPTPAVSLIENMLRFDPSNRSVINEILLSPYFTNVPRTSKSMVFPPTDPDFNFEFERQNLTKYQIRQLIVAEQGFLKRAQEKSGGNGEQIGKEAHDYSLSVEEKRISASSIANADKVRIVDDHLPRANYASRKKEAPADAPQAEQRRGSGNAAAVVDDYAVKTRARSGSNPRGAENAQEPMKLSRHGDRDESESKRSSSGVRQRPPAKVVADKRPIPRAKAPLVVAGQVLDDDDDADAAIEADYERARSYLESRRTGSKPISGGGKKRDEQSAAEVPKYQSAEEMKEKEVLERTKKIEEFHDYQKQLQMKYGVATKRASDTSKHVIDAEKNFKERRNLSEKRASQQDQDFQVDFVSESVISVAPEQSQRGKIGLNSVASRPAREESKDYSDDSDEESVDIGLSQTIPAPVPYPSVPVASIAAAGVPPSPSRMHKRAMSLLDDEKTANRAMASIVSPAAPESPSKSFSQVQLQRKPGIPTHAMSGFGETSGAKGRQQPVPVSTVAPTFIPVPPHNVPKKSPGRRVSPEHRHNIDNHDAGRAGIAVLPRKNQPTDADISLIEHQASEISVLDDVRPQTERRLYKEPARPLDRERDKPAANYRLAAEPPPIPYANREKTEDEIEIEKLEARMKARRLTVPKSPKFSKMTWQRRNSGEEDPSNATRNAATNRATSAPRRNTLNADSSKSRLASIALRNRRDNDSDGESSASDDRNNGKQRNNSSQNIPNYMKPRSESTGRFRR